MSSSSFGKGLDLRILLGFFSFQFFYYHSPLSYFSLSIFFFSSFLSFLLSPIVLIFNRNSFSFTNLFPHVLIFHSFHRLILLLNSFFFLLSLFFHFVSIAPVSYSTLFSLINFLSLLLFPSSPSPYCIILSISNHKFHYFRSSFSSLLF